jgi:fatty aldehyde-generating acyl-ACP reductase
MSNIQFALLGHPASLAHVRSLVPHILPELETDASSMDSDTLTASFESLLAFPIEDTLTVTKPDGSAVRGRLIICTFLPEHTQTPSQLSTAAKKTREGMQLAKDLGAGIVGLGGFTSITGGALGASLPQSFGIAATSGNALTAALAIAQIKDLFNRLSWIAHDHTAAIIGATGDIGRACTLALISELKISRVVLIARNQSRLESLKAEALVLNPKLNIWISADVKDAARADLILAATSAPGPLLNEADLFPGTIVCDVGYPRTVAYAAEPRPEVLVFHGGLASTHTPLPITDYTLLPASNLLHGCFAETIVLALAERYESYSIGQGTITLDRMHAIFDLARAYRFSPAPIYKNNHRVTADDLATFARYAEALREDR